MDPVSHVACGRLLIALVPETRLQRGVVPAAIVGALSPDVDAVFMPVGWDLYLRVHEIGTHTIIGIAPSAILTAFGIRLFARKSSFGVLALAGAVGAASHVLLDLISSAQLRPGWPVIDTHATLPLVAMADPVLFIPLLAGLTAVWFSKERRRVAAASLIAICALMLVKALFFMSALSTYRAIADSSSAAPRVIDASWGTLRTWKIFDRTPEGLRAWHASAGHPTPLLVFSWPIPRETATVTASRSLPTVKNFLRVHELAFATTEARAGGGARVFWSDIRYCSEAKPSEPQADGLSVSMASRVQVACQFWCVSDYAPGGRAIRQILKIGPFTQTRSVDQ
jgi:membrane-bound metal-dependent hydrolase YbcI (DUF457 family)